MENLGGKINYLNNLVNNKVAGKQLKDEISENVTTYINPIKGDVSDSHLNAGGGFFDHPLEINEGVP